MAPRILTNAQVAALETLLNQPNKLQNPELYIKGNVYTALQRLLLLDDAGNITNEGIQALCYTYLRDWSGNTHEHIHGYLNDYQRLYN